MAEVPKKKEEKKVDISKMKPEDIIKTYKMGEGEYRVIVKILEANDLLPKPKGLGFLTGSGSIDPMIGVECLGKKKFTKPKKKTLSPIFNQTFYLSYPGLKKEQLETAVIKFTVYDKSSMLMRDSVIGAYELDLTSIYFSLNHELYQVWLTMTDPTDEREGIMGFVKVNIAVLGPGDEPTIHDINNDKDPNTSKEKNLFSGKVKTEGHEVLVDVFRAEALAPMDLITKNVDAYINAKYSGVSRGTSVVTSSNPEWNQRLVLACGLPNQSKFITIEAFDYDLACKLFSYYLAQDDMIGCFKLKFADIKEKKAVPKWANIYGPPLSSSGTHADLMTLFGQEQGSHYRGRVLFQATSQFNIDPKTIKEDLKFKFPENPQPVSTQRSYVLRVDVMEGHELPERKFGIVHVSMGPYCIKTAPKPIDNGRVMWYDSIDDKRVTFPVSPDEIPDVIFYFADENEEYRRHSFARIKASDIFVSEENIATFKAKPRVVKLKEDRSLDLVTDDEFPGFLFVKVHLFAGQPPPRVKVSQGEIKYVDYQLRVHLYVGRNIPPADETGTSDPFVLVRSSGQVTQSSICYTTINPGWYETLTLNVSLPEFKEDGVPSGMSLVVYDDDDGKRDLIGRSWVEFKPYFHYFKLTTGEHMGEIYEIIFGKPKWLNVLYDATGDVCGKILAGYALIKAEDADKIPIENLYPDCFKESLHLFCIGLRDIDTDNLKAKIASVAFDISGDDYDPIQTSKQKIAENGININKYLSIKIDIPRNRQLCTIIDIFVYEHSNSGEQKLLGVGTIEMSEFIDKYIFEVDQGDQSSLDALNKLGELMPKEKKRDYDEIDDKELPIAWELPFKKKIVADTEYRILMEEALHKTTHNASDKSPELDLRVNRLDDSVNEEDQEERGKAKVMEEQQADLLKSLNNNKQEEIQRSLLMANVRKSMSSNIVPPKNISMNLLEEEEADLQKLVKEHGVGALKERNSRMSLSKEFGKAKSEFKDKSFQFDRNQNPSKELELSPINSKSRNQEIDLMKFLDSQENEGNFVVKKENREIELNFNQPVIVQAENDNAELNKNHDEEDKLIPKIEGNDIRNEINLEKPISIAKSQQISHKSKSSIKSKISIPPFNQSNADIRLFEFSEDKILKSGQISQDGIVGDIEKQEIVGLGQYQSIASDGRIRLKTMRLHSQMPISEASKVSSRALSIRDIPPDNMELAQRKFIKSKRKKPIGMKSLLSAFGSGFKLFGKALSRKILQQMKKNEEHYEEYDTDPDEEYNVEPEWKKDREVMKDDMEDLIKMNETIKKFPILRGQSRGKDNLTSSEKEELTEIAFFKCIFLKKGEESVIAKRVKALEALMIPSTYIARVYVLSGKGIIPISKEGPPDCYLAAKLGSCYIKDKDGSLRKETNNPEFYTCYELPCTLPGSANLKIEIWDYDKFGLEDELIGYTTIDLEDRYFTKTWRQYEKKPIEFRNILPEYGSGSQGRIELWVELIPKRDIRKFLKEKIEPPPHFQMELRTVVWETKDCVFKDELEKCNDVYARGFVANNNEAALETDIHWRCRQKGSFNWRWKFDVKYPLTEDDYGGDRFKIQLWDKDIISADELIGENDIQLNMHMMIEKFSNKV